MALVFFDIFFFISSTFIFQVFESQSTKTGFNPAFIIALQQEIIVKDGSITSEPFFSFSDLNAISKATDPLLTVVENFLLTNFANFSSNFLT